MLTTWLKGGMGNQMFQYAMGLAQAKRLGTGLQLADDWYGGQSYRKYSLCLWRGVIQPVVRVGASNVWETGLPYNQALIDRIKDGDCLEGYWQTEKYFQEIRQELLAIFQPKQPITPRFSGLIAEISKEGPKSSFLAVRRTDTVGGNYDVPLRDYYLEACRRVAGHTPDPRFFVFSDDPEWCKGNLELPYRMTVVEGSDLTMGEHLGREDEDLLAMSLCRHAIIANSSFSWWGAWLSLIPDEERVVVAPKRWLVVPCLDHCDIVPERWIAI